MAGHRGTTTLVVLVLPARASGIAAELYPQSDRANVFHAISLTLLGKKDEARATLKNAVAINSKGIASSGAFNQIALAIAGINKLPEAIGWLEISTEIYPKDAALLGTLGDLYDKTGQSELAIETYRKALAIDPTLEKAKAGLKKHGR